MSVALLAKHYPPSSKQLAIFFIDIYNTMIDEGENKLTILVIADLIATLAVDNVKITFQAIHVINSQLKDRMYHHYNNAFIVMEKLLQIEDTH
jgi:hypothetical protein